MYNELKGEDVVSCLSKIHNIINKYQLSTTNLEGFNEMRNDYNKGNKSWEMLYMLICHSFNYQFRFNNKHEYNSSFGKDRSRYSETTEDNFIKFVNRLNNIDICFSCKDFREIDFFDADENDLVYLDPPYLITCGNYNDGKRGFKGWCEQDELDLLQLCDRLDKQGTRFALSNVLESKGKSNDILKEWSKKYNVNHLNNTYGNCNYHAKDKSTSGTDEVLITNYIMQ